MKKITIEIVFDENLIKDEVNPYKTLKCAAFELSNLSKTGHFIIKEVYLTSLNLKSESDKNGKN